MVLPEHPRGQEEADGESEWGLVRLRKECEHGRYDEHSYYTLPINFGRNSRLCPGGEFLPEGALVIEKEEAAKYRRWWCTSPLQPKCAPGGVHPFEDPDMHESCAWVFVVPSALASQVGESE